MSLHAGVPSTIMIVFRYH